MTSDLVKKKTRKGFIYLGIGVILGIPLNLNTGFFISGFPTLMTSENCVGFVEICRYFLYGSWVTFVIGIPVFFKGLVTLVKRKKLTNKEMIQKSDIKKDEKIEELENRLRKVEEEKSKSQTDSSQEKKE